MTIQQLQYALAVYRAGSISGAAAVLGLAQPNLSGIIRALEEELGYSIFLRNSKGVQATEKGVEALSLAAQLVEGYDKMVRLSSKADAERLRVGGISYAPVCDAFSKLCRELEDRPELEMSYFCEEATSAMDKLLFASLDLVMVLQSPESEDKLQRECRQKGLRITPIADIPIVLRIGPKHPLYHAPEIRLSDFRNYTYVDYNNRYFLESQSLSSIFQINPDRVITVADRMLKNRLISETNMYGIGCKMPPATNERYHFRCIPLGDMHQRLLALERAAAPRSKLAQRYLDILAEVFRNV